MNADNTHLRLHYLEQAYLALLERVTVLERAMDFEVQQREHMEGIVATLPRRIDRLELDYRSRRRGRLTLMLPSEEGAA